MTLCRDIDQVLNKVEEEEAQQAFKDDDPDSDDSEGMAM